MEKYHVTHPGRRPRRVHNAVVVWSQGALPDNGGCDLSTEEDAQVADGMGREHPDDGEGDGEILLESA